jgi:hypothetical protein
MAGVRGLRESTPGSLDFDVWLAPELPTARIPALKFGRDPAVLNAASCEVPGSETVLLEIQSTLASTCGIEIGVERTSNSCEHLPLRSTGLGYILDLE